MNINSLFCRSCLALSIMASTTPAYAAGFQLNGQSATGLGRAFAGDAVIADNASVLARNPAAMSLLERPELSFGLISIDTDVVVKNAFYNGNLDPLPDEQIGDISYVPNIYYVHPINNQLTLGAGIYSNFGTKTEFNDNYSASEMGGLTDLKTVNFGLTASYSLTPKLTAGIGIDIITGQGKITRSKAPLGKLLDVDADGTGFGWNVGLLFKPSDKHRFGFSYRYSPDIEADGTIKRLGKQLPGQLVMKLPDIAEFSGYHQIQNNMALHYSIQYIGWSTFDKLATTNNTTLNTYNWQDGWHYSIGGTYNISEQFALRVGYMYDTSAQNLDKSISVPDSDRQWVSAGFSYYPSENSAIDFGLTYLFGENVTVNEESALGSIIEATTHANAFMYGLQYSYKF